MFARELPSPQLVSHATRRKRILECKLLGGREGIKKSEGGKEVEGTREGGREKEGEGGREGGRETDWQVVAPKMNHAGLG